MYPETFTFALTPDGPNRFGIKQVDRTPPIGGRQISAGELIARGWNAAMRYMKANPDLPEPINVIFHNPATIVYWDDGTKTVVKCQPGDTFNPEIGLTTAMLKKCMGNDSSFNNIIRFWLENAQYTGTSSPALPETTE